MPATFDDHALYVIQKQVHTGDNPDQFDSEILAYYYSNPVDANTAMNRIVRHQLAQYTGEPEPDPNDHTIDLDLQFKDLPEYSASYSSPTQHPHQAWIKDQNQQIIEFYSIRQVTPAPAKHHEL